MATVAEFTLSASSFPLGRLFKHYPSVTVELERVVPTKPKLIPYIWIHGATPGQIDEIVATADSIPGVTRCVRVDELNGTHLLRLEWGPEYQGILRAVTEMDGTLVSALGSADSWSFEIRSDSRDGVSQFQAYCREHGIDISLTSLRALAELKSDAAYGLTAAQREALVLAYERGYYQSPRQVSLDELAAEVGITGQAFGARLRRGINQLVSSALVESES